MADGTQGAPPFIEVRQLVCEGTYDAYQWERVGGRQSLFDASLFGTLLSADTWAHVPPEWEPRLREAAPSFSPDGRGEPVATQRLLAKMGPHRATRSGRLARRKFRATASRCSVI